MSSPSEAFTYVSLFAGCGGSSLGYHMAGGRCLCAVEFDANAAATYRLNFPEAPVIERDIREVTAEEVMAIAGLVPGQLDVLDGSPPCQGFSTAGKRQFGDPRNSLFRDYIRLLEALQPRAFVMENVSGLVKGKMKLAFRTIMESLKATGYRVRCQLLNAMWFGVPQSRQRLIWIGVRPDLEREVEWPKAEAVIPLKAICQDAIASRSESINPWIPAARPCCTLTKTPFRGLLKIADGLREPTESELRTIGSFPGEFRFIGGKMRMWERIGNSVPPQFMRRIAEAVRDSILLPSRQTALLSSTGERFPMPEEAPQ